ncbi:MAG: hormogonium polysaccharide biosynthesis protein HpsA [Pegethrix bostrychoides GSE-TBD4-15B]|jgi:hypothetical protein|uniref:Hormogonium polysaccharide biosynthesis protein HpsA n=1 Tax=Pegethrix bostrychoides GSE-TBD4-15B TaxID=2839662 RepID=A0A951PBJ7_9CYAN|nr:hormogonium polysaccharide biosynthesis protein HpsA [Pegethrix bostrychoides GSE-TBD4-15B]
MSTPKIIRAAQVLLRQVGRIARGLTKGLVSGLLRGWLRLGRRPASQAGFVLPTTILLLLVVVLTVGAIGYRTFTRSQQAIVDRQQQVVSNAATPVIDRARSKIEFLLDSRKDTRGGGVPSGDQLVAMMLNDGQPVNGTAVAKFPQGSDFDPYTFPGEERLDIGGTTGAADGRRDNAWRYPIDLNGDGKTDGKEDGWAVYSIIFQTPPPNATGNDSLRNSQSAGWQSRASKLFIRNAPLSNTNQTTNLCQRNVTAGGGDRQTQEAGWFVDQRDTTKIRKNFQVDAYVVPNNPNGTVATLEFQQDREATRGFKWAAWFRYDLEIFPGPVFNWNGAMHTESNLIVGGSDKFRGYLVSSTESCINDKGASDITARLIPEDQANKPNYPGFKGRFIVGTVRDDNFSGDPTFDLVTGGGALNPNRVMKSDTDSVDQQRFTPVDFAAEPVVLQTQGLTRTRNAAITPVTNEAGNWPNGEFSANGNGRFTNITENTTPNLDDTFRADNRWGPRPTWGPDALPIGVTDKDKAGTEATAKIGEPIVGVEVLTGSDPTPGTDSDNVGLDGYWERRARVDGLRLIVGQRLELGDPAGWGGPGTNENRVKIGNDTEPLMPWPAGCTSGDRCNEDRQRKTLWDNLASVQATAIYHNSADTTGATRDFPDACLATTVHPGTPTTLDRSSTFENLAFGLPTDLIPGYTDKPVDTVITDFLRGRGTNGWEFEIPRVTEFSNLTSPTMLALRNLANYAGDPLGGAPSFKPTQERGRVHPYPAMAMWGNYSTLRQVFKLLDSGTSYDNLSPADKTTLHTAACTLGMLAYNLDYLEKFNVQTAFGVDKPSLTDADPAKSILGVQDRALATGNNLTVNAATVALPAYSAGLRGQIRVIDHIIKGLINGTATDLPAVGTVPASISYQKIPKGQRPPLTFVNSLRDLTPSGLNQRGMNFMAWDANGSNNPETYVRLLERWRDEIVNSGLTAAEQVQMRLSLNRSIELAQLTIAKEQVARDRTWGFYGRNGEDSNSNGTSDAYSFAPLGDCGLPVDAGGVTGWINDPAGKINILSSAGTPAPNEPQVWSDPLHRFCSTRPRYPILYSLFPAAPAKADGSNLALSGLTLDQAYASGFVSHKDLADPEEDSKVRDRETSGASIASFIADANGDTTYRVVRPADIALQPRTLTRLGVTLGGGSNWVLPNANGTPTSGSTPNSSAFNLIKICRNDLTTGARCSEPQNSTTSFQIPRVGQLVRVAFKDTVFYNGRELMPVRALNLDLDLMRTTAIGSDWWLPKKAVVYAFREDAISEGNIVRPNAATWASCDDDAKLAAPTCQMNTHSNNAYRSVDPPLNDNNLITPKPVDYYPDPDRRPYGFRLIRGASLNRAGDEGLGLSFITDDAAYVQGDFNLHQNGGGTRLEEFTEQLTFDGTGRYNNFYDRKTPDTSFAEITKDQWRPSEVVADAVTLLSANFCDGSIEDGLSNIGTATLPVWLRNRYGCTNAQQSSYFNQTRPRTPVANGATARGVTWQRANVADSFPGGVRTATVAHSLDEGESPIFFSRDGRPINWRDTAGTIEKYQGTYATAKDNTAGKSPSPAVETRMNMILVSNLVPSRKGQSYGGLHNFPRFNENWGGDDLFISGAFLQLNFSSYGTAPFDQENWQVGSPAPVAGSGNNEWISYYAPPNRRWGYDPALKYGKTSPVAARFQFSENTRSEFYSEPAANDPYIRNLCAKVPAVPSRPAPGCPT